MKKIEVPNELSLLLRKAIFEHRIATTNLSFMLRNAMLNNDSSFLDSDLFKDLQAEVAEASRNKEFIVASVFTVMTNMLVSDVISYAFVEDLDYLVYEEISA